MQVSTRATRQKLNVWLHNTGLVPAVPYIAALELNMFPSPDGNYGGDLAATPENLPELRTSIQNVFFPTLEQTQKVRKWLCGNSHLIQLIYQCFKNSSGCASSSSRGRDKECFHQNWWLRWIEQLVGWVLTSENSFIYLFVDLVSHFESFVLWKAWHSFEIRGLKWQQENRAAELNSDLDFFNQVTSPPQSEKE